MQQPGARFAFHDLHPDTGSFLDDVIAGLARERKTLPPKYFYDERGCELFEAICKTPEYYVTRTETALMRGRAAAMARRLGARCAVVEYGSGSASKTRILLKALAPVAYVPVDIAREQLLDTAAGIARDFPDIAVTAVCADYSRALRLPRLGGLSPRRRVVYFPGSTIGNFTPAEAAGFLANARRLVGAGGGLLIGVDLVKDPACLNAAYNDRRGVTAAFNMNLLARVNRELGADFNLSAFRHQAFYNGPRHRIEMHLLSLKDQRVSIAGRIIRFRAGESIHTENSCKYSVQGFQALARDAGFEPVECWTDAKRLFSVHYLAVPPSFAQPRD
jgi:dimethylhistidine N-methyltransferase